MKVEAGTIASEAAIAHSTLLSTVSPTYAEEIQTPAYGFGLDGVLRSRRGGAVSRFRDGM